MQVKFVDWLQPTLRIMLALVIALVATFPAAPTFVSAAPLAQTNGPVNLSITPSADPIVAGQTVQFRVRLENTSGGPLPDLEMRLPIDGPVEGVRARVASRSGVPQSRMEVRKENEEGKKEVIWRGGLLADGVVIIIIGVKSDAASAGGEIVINPTVGPQDGQVIPFDEARVSVNPLDKVDEQDVNLNKSIVTPDEVIQVTDDTTYDIGPRSRLGLRLQLENSSNQTVYSLVVGEITPSTDEVTAAAMGTTADRCAARIQNRRVLNGRGITVPPQALVEAGFPNADYGFLVATPAGDTTTMGVRVQTVGSVGCQFRSAESAYLTNLPPTQSGQFDAENALALLPQFQGLPSVGAFILFLIIVSNDLGDAPDSTNNDGVPMDAYGPGGPAARFPTVFNPSTGPDQGPVHRNPYPLRLGGGVAWEFEADRLAGRNLIPTTNTNNLSAFDDGLDVATLNFAHCFPPPPINYEVTANQTAVNLLAPQNGLAYVNVWLDGNSDGDWQDTLNCDGLTAYEHIVVDQQIFITAPGTLNLVLATGNIPIPQNGVNEPMWLRITISDEPSVKVPAGGPVGDGRGPAGGFRLGETEDYLYQRTPGAPIPPPPGQGPDVRLDLENTIEVEALTPDGAIAAAGADSGNGRFLNTVLRLRNTGNFSTGNVRLVLESDPYIGTPTTTDAKCCRCLTCTVASALTVPLTVEELEAKAEAETAAARVPFKEVCENGQCRLEADLGYMEPGDGGRLFARFNLPPEVTENVDITARLITEDDVNPDNNEQSLLSRLPLRTPTISRPGEVTLGWTGCLTCTVAAGGVELLEFEVAGFAEPNSTLRVFNQGTLSAETEVTADADGFWQGLLALPDGSHQLVAEYLKIPDIDGESVKEIDASTPKLLEIVSQLPWNPATFGFTKIVSPGGELLRISEDDDSCGPWSFQDPNGRTDPNNWRIPVWRGATHEIGIDLNCTEGSAQLNWEGLTEPLQLVGPDEDGRYTADFEAPIIAGKIDVSLTVTCDGVETEYGGFMIPILAEPAQVVNAVTGDPLAGAQVTLWQRNLDGAGAKIVPWQAQAYGQTNPQSTNAQGEFSFIVPPGGYGLTAQIDGFQRFQSGPFTLQGIFPSRSIALTPNAPSGPAAQVSISDDGFDPPALSVPVGATVEWSNTGLLTHSSVAVPATLQAADANDVTWDSGELAPGDSYRLRFDQAGTYTYVNAEDPSQEATIIVTSNTRVFMPIVTK